MKYIRTKDGRIIETNKLIIIPSNTSFQGEIYNGEVVSEDEIINQADTIEELCDEWICRDNDNIEYRPYRFYFLDDLYAFIKENKLFERYTVYGAIWTDKGLIYVTKMNDKGELELLWESVYMNGKC